MNLSYPSLLFGQNLMDQFQIEQTWWNNEPMVLIQGQFTSQHIAPFRNLLDEIASTAPARILIDMQSLSFIDSLGIGVLIFYYNNLLKSGVKITLFRPSPAVEEILKLTSLDKVIPIELA